MNKRHGSRPDPRRFRLGNMAKPHREIATLLGGA